MTFTDLINRFKTAANNHKFVHEFNEGDVYEVMNNGEKLYSNVVLTPGTILITPEDITFNLNIFYIDRLLEASENKLNILSTAVNTLQQIINNVKTTAWQDGDYLTVDNYSITVFTEKFQDLCAGAYATVNISIQNNINDCSTELL